MLWAEHHPVHLHYHGVQGIPWYVPATCPLDPALSQWMTDRHPGLSLNSVGACCSVYELREWTVKMYAYFTAVIIIMCFPLSLCVVPWPHWQRQPAYPAGLLYDAAGPQLNWPHSSNPTKTGLLTAPTSLGGWCLKCQPHSLWRVGWPSLALLLCSPPSLCWK